MYWPHRRLARRESIRAGEEGGIYTWCRNFIGIIIGFILSKIAAWGVSVFIVVCNQGLLSNDGINFYDNTIKY